MEHFEVSVNNDLNLYGFSLKEWLWNGDMVKRLDGALPIRERSVRIFVPLLREIQHLVASRVPLFDSLERFRAFVTFDSLGQAIDIYYSIDKEYTPFFTDALLLEVFILFREVAAQLPIKEHIDAFWKRTIRPAGTTAIDFPLGKKRLDRLLDRGG